MVADLSDGLGQTGDEFISCSNVQSISNRRLKIDEIYGKGKKAGGLRFEPDVADRLQPRPVPPRITQLIMDAS